MIRVLHLLPQTPDFETERGAATLAEKIGGSFSITRRTIGRGGDYRNMFLASFLLRDIVHDFDMVHAWGESARMAAIPAGAQTMIFSRTEFPAPKALSWLIKPVSNCQVHIACPTQTLHDVYVAAGVSADQITLIRPGVDTAAVTAGRDPDLRRALGFDDADYVVLAPGESTRAAGHYDAIWAASILHVLDATYKVLIWGRGDQTLSCVRLAEKIQQPQTLSVAQWKLGRRMEFEELPAADVAVFAPSAPTQTLPLSLCMAAGRPIVATPTPLAEEVLKKYDNAVFVERHAPRLLAQSVLELRKEGRARAVISGSYRKGKPVMHSSKRFVEEFRRLYRLAAR